MTKKKILVVEDDNIIGMEIRDRIKNIGYDVPEILSYGEDAVEKVGHIKPDLILMDIHLNGEMDGIQAAEQIREIVNIPVVYLTAYADDSTLQRAKKTEPFGYVIKPFEERDLASTIEMALYKHQMDTKLKNNERWLTTTLRSIGDGVIATNREGKINYMNPVAESLTGWLVSDIMYKDLNEVFKLVEDKTRAVINNPIEKVFKKKAITELPDTTILISKDNVERPVLVTYSPLIDDKNNVTGVVLVFQDNTERKKAQETLSRQNQYNEIRAELWKLATDKSLSEDQLITRALQIIGPALNVSRACYSKLFGNYLEEGEFQCILEWCDEDVKPSIGEALPTNLVNYFINKKINYIDLEIALKMIPKGTAKIAKPVLKAFAKKMNLDSIFLVPYYLNDNLEGLITFDTCKDKVNKPTWTEESKQLIFEALDIVSNFIIQKRNEDALRESEERFRTIFETTPDLIFIKDLYQTYTHVNPAMAKQFDKSKEQLIGLNDDELFGFEVAKQTKEIDSKVLKGSIIKEDATELISGHDKVFDVVKVPMKNHRGKIIGLCGMARDVTKRKKAEDIQNVVYEISHAINTTKDLQELFKSIQDSLGKVVDTTNFYIALYHQENDTLTLPYMVDEKDRFTEFPVKDTITSLVIRKKKTLLVTEDEIIKLAKQEKIELAGTLPKVWLGVPLKSGKKVIGIIAVQSYTDASTYSKEHSDILELVSGSIATAIEKKRAEEARIRLETAINHTAEMIMITDNRGKIQYVNPAFVKVTGYTESDVIGKNPKILKSDKQDDYFYKHLWSTISSGNTWIGHFTNRTKSGKLYEEDSAISPIFDEAGEIINYVAVKRDVSEHLQLEMRLRQAEKMEAIGTLAGGIAHDFNNIIGAIIGYTELSMDDVKDEATIHNLKQIIKASHRAKDLVQQILAFSRQDEKERKPLQISLIVKEALKMLRASLPATIDIIPNIQDKAGLVLADPTHIHQVVMNLCLNSAHAMREKGGELEVSLKEVKIDNDSLKQYQELKAGPYIKLMVKDSGQGIDANIIDRIFEPYFTTKEVDEGSGMGLSLVHGIVKRYNGEITVFSEKNKGTTINVLLPKIFKKLNNHIEGKKPLKKGHEKILYIDDEQNLVEVGTQMLKRLGYKVFSTMSSLEALNMFESNPDIYDLVITDQTMPGMTGAELALKLMNIRSDIPIILCTGHSEVISEEKTKEMGIREFIMKPLFSEDLATVIRRVLDT